VDFRLQQNNKFRDSRYKVFPDYAAMHNIQAQQAFSDLQKLTIFMLRPHN
jgi:hypothetical protein